jgi:hypothetical protein
VLQKAVGESSHGKGSGISDVSLVNLPVIYVCHSVAVALVVLWGCKTGIVYRAPAYVLAVVGASKIGLKR